MMPVLTQTSVYELDTGTPSWRKTYATAPTVPSYWAPDGLDWLAVSPTPRGGGLQLEGYKEPPVLTNNSDYIDIGDDELLRILDYAQWYMAFKQGPAEATSNVEPLLQQMMAAAALRNSRLRASALYREFMGIHRDEPQRGTRAPVGKVGVRKYK